MKRRRLLTLAGMTLLSVAGCITVPKAPDPSEARALRDRAVDALKRAIRFEHAGQVRALGIEVMQSRLGEASLPWIRNALHDPEPGVQFAAILGVGTLQDQRSAHRILTVLDSGDENLRVAALYALHRLGDTRRSAELPALLLRAPSVDVRRNVAMVLGLLGESKAVKLLARAMKDEDDVVRQRALESMAMLGSDDAIRQLTFSASSGLGSQRVWAITTLDQLAMPSLEDTFRYKLVKGEYLDTRLAAARALGTLKNQEGLRLALASLEFNRPKPGMTRDSEEAQIRRVRQLAANALGAIGDARALPALERRLMDQADPWVQIAAADAILEIVGVDRLAAGAFGGTLRGE